MALLKTVEVEVTVDSMSVNFADGSVSVAGTAKGTLLGKSYSVNLPPEVSVEWAKQLQDHAITLMDKTGALWRA